MFKVGDTVKLNHINEEYTIHSITTMWGRTMVTAKSNSGGHVTGDASQFSYYYGPSDPSSNEHKHIPKKYVGFTDSYDYCDDCGLRLGK